jgi:hypothetical protein
MYELCQNFVVENALRCMAVLILLGHDGNQFGNQARDAKFVLSFNESERGEQANMSPAAAARAWEQSIKPLRDQGIRLGSPAIALTKEGLNWMQQFLQELVGSANCIEWSTIRIG